MEFYNLYHIYLLAQKMIKKETLKQQKTLNIPKFYYYANKI